MNENMEVVKTVEQEVVKKTIGKKGKFAIAVGAAIGIGTAIGIVVKRKINGKKHVTMNLEDMKHELENSGATVIMPEELEMASVSNED